MTRFVERLALMGSFSVLSVAVLTGAKSTARSLADARIEQLTTRLDAVERRLAAVERGTARSGRFGSIVTAPFLVMSENGTRLILSVTSKPSIDVFGDSGRIVASIGEHDGGGFFRALNKNQFEASMGVPGLPQFRLESPLGTLGAFGLGTDGNTALVLRNTLTGQSTVALSQGARGDGILQILTAKGDLMIEAGVEEGVGMVRVGPQWSCVVRMGILAPACIKGHK
jgi:hypothetical protein